MNIKTNMAKQTRDEAFVPPYGPAPVSLVSLFGVASSSSLGSQMAKLSNLQVKQTEPKSQNS